MLYKRLNDWWILLLLVAAWIVWILTMPGCAHCPTPGEMRCMGPVVEVCNGVNNWIATRNCKDLTTLHGGNEQWTCDYSYWNAETKVAGCVPTP